MTRHADLQGNAELGPVGQATALIADQQVRNRGTIGGSLVHGDPASDLPTVFLACEGSLTVVGAGGTREVAAADMFEDYLTTAVGEGEIVTEIRVPSFDGWGSSYLKFTRRAEDWAMVAVLRDGQEGGRRLGRGRAHRPDQHGLHAAARHRRGGRPARQGRSTPSRRPPSRRPRAPTRRATSTPRRTTSATWRGCSPAGHWKRRRPDPPPGPDIAGRGRRGARQASATSPTARWPPRCSWPPSWASRCWSRARPAWARPRWPRRWPPPPARGSSACSATRASTSTTPSTTGTTRASCMAVRAAEGGVDEGELYSRRFLLRRPLLEALEADGPVVLLIDEIDRADDEFEAFLLELLSDFQVTIPELGTITAARAPAGRADLQPHARAARRAQAPLHVPLDRLPRSRARDGDRPHARARRRGGRRRARRRGRRAAAPRRALQAARRGGDDRVGAGAGRARARTGRSRTRSAWR